MKGLSPLPFRVFKKAGIITLYLTVKAVSARLFAEYDFDGQNHSVVFVVAGGFFSEVVVLGDIVVNHPVANISRFATIATFAASTGIAASKTL